MPGGVARPESGHAPGKQVVSGVVDLAGALSGLDQPRSPLTVATLAHQPVSPEGAEVVLIEPAATVNTGDSPGERTAPRRLA